MLSRKGQYVIEYAIVLAVVAAALVAMQRYIYRAVNSKFTAVGYEYHYMGEDWASKHPGGESSSSPGARPTVVRPGEDEQKPNFDYYPKD